MERRLGRGLGSLLSTPTPGTSPGTNPTEIEVARIRPNPFQPRKNFDADSLQELRASIERHGVLQPIVVRAAEDGFELIAGERRWRAARLAGRETLPAVVRTDVDDAAMLELALVENVQRRDLDPIERARAFRQLQEHLGLKQEEIATRVSLRRSTVTNHLRLLELPEDVQNAVAQGLLSMGHARALLGLRDPKEMRALMREAIRRELSVREVERRVREGTRRSEPKPTTAEEPPPWVAEVETRLRRALGTKVRIENRPGYRGQVVIEYYDRPGLDGLLERLAPRPSLGRTPGD